MYCIVTEGKFFVTRDKRKYSPRLSACELVAFRELQPDKDFYKCIYECVEIIKNHNLQCDCAIFDVDSKEFCIYVNKHNKILKENIKGIQLPNPPAQPDENNYVVRDLRWGHFVPRQMNFDLQEDVWIEPVVDEGF